MNSQLINELARHGVAVHIEGGRVRVSLPWPPEKIPAEVKALLRELKAREQHGQLWSEPAALAQFRAALDRIRRRFPPDCIGWVKQNQPRLWQAVLAAQKEFDQAFHGQDMTGCRRAAAGYEQAFGMLVTTYEQQRVLTTEEAIAAFGCGRVWDLPPGKAAVLDTVFAKRGIRWQKCVTLK
ncbi:hypothetical protein IT084_14580 [Desulfallas sp. Bu1-1]|nr:hypothetical protein [Desulfallas sp. Bu1-1]